MTSFNNKQSLPQTFRTAIDDSQCTYIANLSIHFFLSAIILSLKVSQLGNNSVGIFIKIKSKYTLLWMYSHLFCCHVYGLQILIIKMTTNFVADCTAGNLMWKYKFCEGFKRLHEGGVSVNIMWGNTKHG